MSFPRLFARRVAGTHDAASSISNITGTDFNFLSNHASSSVHNGHTESVGRAPLPDGGNFSAIFATPKSRKRQQVEHCENLPTGSGQTARAVQSNAAGLLDTILEVKFDEDYLLGKPPPSSTESGVENQQLNSVQLLSAAGNSVDTAAAGPENYNDLASRRPARRRAAGKALSSFVPKINRKKKVDLNSSDAASSSISSGKAGNVASIGGPRKRSAADCIARVNGPEVTPGVDENGCAAVGAAEDLLVAADPFLDTDAVALHACRYPECGKSFSSPKRLESHVATEHESSDTEFVCEVCGKPFANRRYRINHSYTHAAVPEYGCEICGRQFTSPKNLFSHRKIHAEQKPFACHICGKQLTTSRTLRQHLFTHSVSVRERPFKCEICSKSYQNQAALKAHHRTAHLPPAESAPASAEKFIVACDICGKEFTSKPSMKTHRYSHSGEKHFECDICGKLFMAGRNLSVHKRTHLGDGMKKHGCEHCGMRFMRKATLTDHLATHSGVKSFHCDECDRSFFSKKHLKQHKQAAHSDESFECEECGKIFVTKAYLSAHQVRHTMASGGDGDDPDSAKPFECEICSKRVSSKRSLKEHMYLHTGVMPFECSVCAKQFASRCHLRDHENTHLEPHLKPFECNICQKRYSSQANLRLHMQTHSNPMFPCDICGRPFFKRNQMRRHRFCHMGLRPFECEVCGRCFRTRGTLSGHMRRHVAPPGERPGDRVWECDECGKLLKSKHSCQMHELVHTGEKHFECEQCGKKLSSKHSLTHHKVSQHAGQKVKRRWKAKVAEEQAAAANLEKGVVDFGCKECGEHFLSQLDLRVHRRTHRVEKAVFECETCNKRFVSKQGLQLHAQLHTEYARPYACEFCDETYTQCGSLRRHLLLHAQNGDVPDMEITECLSRLYKRGPQRKKVAAADLGEGSSDPVGAAGVVVDDDEEEQVEQQVDVEINEEAEDDKVDDGLAIVEGGSYQLASVNTLRLIENSMAAGV